MKKAADQPTTPNSGAKDKFSTGVLLSDFLGTAWRIAVPVLLFAGLGIFLDLKLGSKPWLTLGGTVVGFIMAGLLVKKQLEASLEEDK